MRGVVEFLRANPQAAILLAICLVLGLGTLLALLLGVAATGPQASTTSGGDAGAVMLFGLL